MRQVYSYLTQSYPDGGTASCNDWIYVEGKWYSLVRPVVVELGHICTFDCECEVNQECEPDLPESDFDQMLKNSDNLKPYRKEDDCDDCK